MIRMSGDAGGVEHQQALRDRPPRHVEHGAGEDLRINLPQRSVAMVAQPGV